MYKLVIRGVLIFMTLGLIIILLFRERLPFGKSNSSFACEPDREITSIDLSERGKKLSLEKKGDTWIINEDMEARKSGILFILRILREVEIKSPVSDEMFRSEITDKGIEPVRISVYSGRKQLKSFLVYKTSSNSYGNIMKIRAGSKPFIVFVPGFDGDIGSAFTPSELFWQPFTVFNLLPSEIESVNFENLSDTSSSFLITGANHHFTLSAGNSPLTGWDSTLVARYLSYFARITFEKWDLELGETAKKMIESQTPLYRITVKSAAGEMVILTLWVKMKEGEESNSKDSDRLFGKTQSSDEFFVIRYFDIDPLLKKRSYFFPE